MHDYTDEKMVDTLQAVMKARYGHTVTVPDGVQGLPELLRIARQTSHRAWADRPVGADLVRLLAACALAAPSKSHLQQADIIDVRDPVRRAAIHKLVPGMPWMADAPALLVFCANGRRFKRLFERRGLPFANDHLDGFFNPVVDTSLVMNATSSSVSSGEASMACQAGRCWGTILQDTSIVRMWHPGTFIHIPDGLCVEWRSAGTNTRAACPVKHQTSASARNRPGVAPVALRISLRSAVASW